MKEAILFDLGGTLVEYFERSEFPEILKQSITEVYCYLNENDIFKDTLESIWERVEEENYESKDYRVRPLEERLIRIFQLDPVFTSDVVAQICRCFMNPIFDRARLCDDVMPVISNLKLKGFRIAVVSNTTWGSPAFLWREEIGRFGLHKHMDAVVFCRDVGWRKPARQIFDFTLSKLKADVNQCIFVGDDPRWDLAGARNIGIDAILIDRKKTLQGLDKHSISDLYELQERLILESGTQPDGWQDWQ